MDKLFLVQCAYGKKSLVKAQSSEVAKKIISSRGFYVLSCTELEFDSEGVCKTEIIYM